MDYFSARYLSGAQGRFTSTDPVSGWASDPQSWNMYAYARNNPLLYTDPDGQTYRICQLDADGNETNCTERKNELTDNQFNQFQKDTKGKMAIYGGKIYAINSAGSRTQTGSYEQTDVDLNDAAQELFHGNRQLWQNTAVVGNTLAVATGALMALPVAAEAAALPTMEVAVGKFVGSWHVVYRATGGPWSHGIRVVGQSGVEITSAGLQRFVASAWKISIGIPILDSGAVSATLGNVANSCARGACDGFLRGWGLK